MVSKLASTVWTGTSLFGQVVNLQELKESDHPGEIVTGNQIQTRTASVAYGCLALGASLGNLMGSVCKFTVSVVLGDGLQFYPRSFWRAFTFTEGCNQLKYSAKTALAVFPNLIAAALPSEQLALVWRETLSQLETREDRAEALIRLVSTVRKIEDLRSIYHQFHHEVLHAPWEDYARVRFSAQVLALINQGRYGDETYKAAQIALQSLVETYDPGLDQQVEQLVASLTPLLQAANNDTNGREKLTCSHELVKPLKAAYGFVKLPSRAPKRPPGSYAAAHAAKSTYMKYLAFKCYLEYPIALFLSPYYQFNAVKGRRPFVSAIIGNVPNYFQFLEGLYQALCGSHLRGFFGMGRGTLNEIADVSAIITNYLSASKLQDIFSYLSSGFSISSDLLGLVNNISLDLTYWYGLRSFSKGALERLAADKELLGEEGDRLKFLLQKVLNLQYRHANQHVIAYSVVALSRFGFIAGSSEAIHKVSKGEQKSELPNWAKVTLLVSYAAYAAAGVKRLSLDMERLWRQARNLKLLENARRFGLESHDVYVLRSTAAGAIAEGDIEEQSVAPNINIVEKDPLSLGAHIAILLEKESQIEEGSPAAKPAHHLINKVIGCNPDKLLDGLII